MVSELFQLFDSMRDQVGILNWGLKRTTLEDGEWHKCFGMVLEHAGPKPVPQVFTSPHPSNQMLVIH